MLSQLPEQERRRALLKFQILAEGIRVTEAALRVILQGKKQPLRTRSGVSGGLDLDLQSDIFVNAPTEEKFARASTLNLDVDFAEQFVVNSADASFPVRVLPEPTYYSASTRDGRGNLRQVGQMCSGDRFCYGMTGPSCAFWGKAKRCQYCSIGAPYNPDLARKQEEDLLYALEKAVADDRLPARHILIGGGTPPGADMGARRAARLSKAIKKRWNIPIYVMIAAPLENEHIEALIDAGVDEIGLNIEFWSDAAWKRYIPGKDKLIGKARYLQALEYCVSRIGPINTRSIIIVGLEPLEETIKGVTRLAEMGVMPILSPFRPLEGSELANAAGLSASDSVTVFEECHKITANHGLPLGPTCINCQNNVLALPFGPAFRYYPSDTTVLRNL